MMENLVAQIPAAFIPSNSRNSDGSATVAPLYQPTGYWSQNQSSSLGSKIVHQWPKYMGYPLNSLSMDFQTRNNNSLTPTKALPSSYDNSSLSPTSTGSSSVQQQQQTIAVNIPSHGHHSPPPVLQRSSFPPMKQFPNLSHSPSNRVYLPPICSYLDTAQDRPFKCVQCPQSFKRNHDLTRHKRIHLAIKPFACGDCKKGFSRKDVLQKHNRVRGCGKNANATSIADVGEHTVINNSEVMGDSAEGESPEILF
ncbi:hypothetical protein DL95DRAFT_394612 [Leptodontidium sp. 2 PMI_412]|nr:hypothetical protein DL95DRAFT_394612 [Leptodontidium sp. 2 PMI_412]